MIQHLLKNNTNTIQNPGFQEKEVYQDLRNLRGKNVWHDIEAKHILSWTKKHLKIISHNKT